MTAATETITPGEWARRFKARIVARLTPPNGDWENIRAHLVAEDEYDATQTYDALTGFETDPEGSADEALSCWEA